MVVGFVVLFVVEELVDLVLLTVVFCVVVDFDEDFVVALTLVVSVCPLASLVKVRQ